MSVESARAFIEKLKADEVFAQKVTECRDTKDWIALAKETGFDVSVDDITVEDMVKALEELDDKKLDKVSGGMRGQHWA